MKTTRRQAVVAIAVTGVIVGACAPRDANRPEIGRLQTHMKHLASDENEGRGLGQPGLERAVAHVAGVFEAAGLAPGQRREGEPESFLQAVPFVRYRYGTHNRVTIEAHGSRQVLTHGDEVILFHPGRYVRPPMPNSPVFVGYGIHEPGLGHDDYANVVARGRWILVMEGVPEWASDELQKIYGDPTRGPERQYDAAMKHGVAGVLAIPHARAYEHWDTLRHMRQEQSIAATRDYAGGEIRDPVLPVVALRQDILRQLFEASGYDPVTREGSYGTFELAGLRVGLSVDVERDELVSHNVVGLVPGTDPQLRDQLVVASAHIDHLGIIQGEIHNGANDDASGCAAILEAARIIAADPQPRSVLFVLFTSEESEHLGSLHFLAESPLPGARVIASINLEHVGRSNDGTLLATVSDVLRQPVERVRASHRQRLRTTPLDERGQTVRGSDSYSFFLHGIPLVIVGGGGFHEYHSPDDDLQYIDFELLNEAVSITVDLIRELSGTASAEDEGG